MARGRVVALRRAAGNLRPPSRTALRTPPDRRPPSPEQFAAFGERSWIVPPARVVHPAAISVGADVVILDQSTLFAGAGAALLQIGRGVRFGRFCVVAATIGVVIGDDVSASDGAAVVDSWGPFEGRGGLTQAFPGARSLAAPVTIGAGAYLGALSVVGPGVRVGAGAYIGEGAVVVEDVADHVVVRGNPAVVVRAWDASAGAWSGGA